MRSWRNLPPALLAMFAIELVAIVVLTTYDLTHSITARSDRFDLATSGLWLASDALGMFGALALTRRLTGSAATGMRVIAAAFGLSLVASVAWDSIWTLRPEWALDHLRAASDWSWFVIKLLPLAGIAISTFSTHPRLALLAVVTVLLADSPPPLAHHLWGWLVHGYTGQMLLYQVLRIATLAALAAGLVAIAPEPYPAPPSDAAPGFHAIASGLWLRVIGACTFAGLMLLLVLGKSGEGAVSVLKLATISVAVVNALSFFIVARGALSTLVREMPVSWMTAGAVANLWCLGVTLRQLPWTYKLLYGARDFGYASDLETRAQALSIIAPLVAVAGIAVIVAAIAVFAANRGLAQLHDEARGKGLGFVMLMIAAVGIQNWLLPDQTSDGSAMFLLLAAAGCSLGATVLMARLCTRAADSLHAETALPTATLRS